MTDPIREKIIAKTMGMKGKQEETINDVEQAAHNMGVVEGAMETAKKLAGSNELSQQLNAERQRGDRLEKEKDKATEQAHAAEIQNVRTELGAKIDHLAESIKAGASQRSLGEEIAEIKKAATELGMGGSKISEIQEMMNLIERLNPRKNLAEQVKEARDLLTTLQPTEDKGKGILVEGVPAQVAIELKRMDHNLQIKLEEMEDDRQRKDQEFKLTLRKYDDEKSLRQQEIEGKLAIERERNEMIAGGLDTLGRAIGKGMAEARGGGIAGQPVQSAQNVAKRYILKVPEGEFGEFDCPNCHTTVAIGPTSTEAQCVGCNAKFPITRVSASPADKTNPEPIPGTED